ncbi:MAG: TonB-dependent receptor, partial [Pseudomonadales bacterium]
MYKKNKLSSAVASVILLMIGAQEVNAQSSGSTGATLEEVTVTARRKSENLQTVPDTIVAISADMVERANIVAARDIAMKIPNVSLVESLSPTSTYIIVRGIASVRNSEPAVAVVVDGVQIGSSTEVSQSYFDVEQIELLKGPQGALYGRNALGGALIITSKAPTDELTGKVRAGTGSDGLFEVSGALSGPLTDTLKFRVAANHRSFDGDIENTYLNSVLARNNAGVTGPTPSSSNMNFEENNDLRAQLFWDPTDATSVNYRYARNDIESGAMWYRNIFRSENDPDVVYEEPISSNGNPTAIRLIETHTLKIDSEFDAGVFTSITNVTDTNERYGLAGETRGHDRTANVWFHTQDSVEDMIAGMDNQVDIDFFTANLGAELGGSFVGSDQYYDIQTFSQEFRFAGDVGDNFNYVAGAYLLLTERQDTIRATWENNSGVPFDCEPKYDGGPSINNGDCNGLLFSTQNEQDNTAWALFFSTDYRFTDSLVLTVAGRYDEDQREVTRIDGPTVDTFGLGVGNVGTDCDSVADPDNCAASGSKISKTFSSFQPKISLAYTPNDEMTYYGTYAVGFRSGGFNASGALLTDDYEAETL